MGQKPWKLHHCGEALRTNKSSSCHQLTEAADVEFKKRVAKRQNINYEKRSCIFLQLLEKHNLSGKYLSFQKKLHLRVCVFLFD